MRIDSYSFGVITIDGITYEHDVVLEHGSVSKRRKKQSKPFRALYGHTPLSVEEDIPWRCRRLVVGTGAAGSLPVMDEVFREADRQGVKLMRGPNGGGDRAASGVPQGHERRPSRHLLKP